jgi:phosphatidylglycerophosphatase A
MKHLALSKVVWRRLDYFIAFGFGSGLMPTAPGTWGTLAALPIYGVLIALPFHMYVLSTIVAFALGVYVCHRVSSDLGVHDYSGIVWDEIVGYLVTMLGAPFGWSWMLLGFCLFRFFDIYKPMPIAWVDKHVHGGLGIMLDDVAAAIPSWLCLQCIAYLWLK